MRLFHVSENPDITEFVPRLPRVGRPGDLDPDIGLVWAVNEECLPNFLTPRDCPRVAYHATKSTAKHDVERFFSAKARHVVAVEHGWYEKLSICPLYIYEFDTKDFVLQDPVAGYYVAKITQIPINMTKIPNGLKALMDKGIELRFLDNLWDLGHVVQNSTLNWSLCVMRNATSLRR
jgi:hypothetical protein